MAYSRRSSGSDREYVLMPVRSVAGSEFGGRERDRRHRHDQPIEVNNFLEVPQGRPRASSQGGGVAPTIVNIGTDGRERSRSRHRDRHHRHRRDSSGSSSGYSSDRSRHRHRDRRPSRGRDPIDEEDLPYKLRKELDLARAQRREDDDQRKMDRIKRERDEERRRWKMEEDEENLRKKKEKEAILLEAKLEEERKKKEQEALRKKILADEEEKRHKEKQKKKEEEEEFERKVKEKFMSAGMFHYPYYRIFPYHRRSYYY
jgi:hypothetical protein